MSDFYDSDSVINARGSFRNSGRLTTDLLLSDFRTGTPLPISGTLPVICSSAVCSDRANRLFDAAGLPDATERIIFHNESDYESALADCRRRRKPVVFQGRHAGQQLPRELYWIDPELLRELNDEASLPRFVPTRNLPRRTVVSVRDLPAFLNSSLEKSFVLKGAANMPNDGGRTVVMICTARDLEKARVRLEAGGQIVAEEFLSIEERYCVSYATDGRQTFLLGSCDRIAQEPGRGAGTWISLVRHPPREAVEVGFEIMQRAANRGYVGLAELDIVRDSRNRILVIDLNFRLGESTPALMWQHRLLSRSGPKSVGRVIGWGFRQAADPDFSLLRELVESGWFFPLTAYDPQASPYEFDEARVTGILFGSSRFQVEQRLKKLQNKFGNAAQAARKTSTSRSNPRAA